MNKRVILIAVLVTLIIINLNTLKASSDTVNLNEKGTVQQFCNTSLSSIGNYNDIEAFLEDHDEIRNIVYSSKSLDLFVDILNSGSYTCSESDLLTMISYIECGYATTDINSLRSYLTPITLVTLANKTIDALRYVGPEPLSAYNCHSYAWYYGGNYNDNDRIKFYNPTTYYQLPSCYSCIYNHVSLSQINKSNVSVGDIVLYFVYPDEDIETGGSDRPFHSAIVTLTSGSVIQVKGKNGPGAVVYGPIDGLCYLAEGGAHDGMGRLLSIYHPSHAINTSWVANQNYKYKNTTKHYIACIYCARGTTGSTENHSFVTVGTIKKCTKCGYRIELSGQT